MMCAQSNPVASCLGERCQQVVAESIVECFSEVSYPALGTKAEIDEAFSKLAKCGGHHALSHMLAQDGLNALTKQRCESLIALGNSQLERPREDVLANLERNAPVLICKESAVANACFSGDSGKCHAGLAVPATQCRQTLDSRLPTTVSQALGRQLFGPFATCLLKTYRPATLTNPCRASVDYTLMKLDRNSKRAPLRRGVEKPANPANAL